MQQGTGDQELLRQLQRGEESAIEAVFRQHYAWVCRSVMRIIPDESIAEDIAQDVFYELYRKRGDLNIQSSLKAYLRRAAVNRALNHLRDQKIRFAEEDAAPVQESYLAGAQQLIEAEQLQSRIDQAIDGLPARCRVIFVLSRFEELSYKEIAEHLDISPKTVENQIAKALRLLREALAAYLPALLLLLKAAQ